MISFPEARNLNSSIFHKLVQIMHLYVWKRKREWLLITNDVDFSIHNLNWEAINTTGDGERWNSLMFFPIQLWPNTKFNIKIKNSRKNSICERVWYWGYFKMNTWKISSRVTVIFVVRVPIFFYSAFPLFLLPCLLMSIFTSLE